MEAEAAEAGPTTSEPPPMEDAERSAKRARQGPLLFGAELIEHEGPQDELVEAAPQGAEAIPANPPAAVQVDKGRLYCSLCSSLLKPPIYQCAVSAYAHCPGLDLFFGDLRVPCHFAEYGCESFVPYFRSDDHRDACVHAPCHCPEPGCYLVCSPRAFSAHLTGEHSWPADEIAYGTLRMLAVPVPPAASAEAFPARHLRLLRGDDASLFMVAAGQLGDGAAVSAVVVRANSPAHPRFTCTFCAKPAPEAAGLDVDGACFFATMPLRSSALADGAGVAPEKELYFAVPREMLCEGSRELAVSIRIDRSCGPEPPLEDHKMVAQN